MNVVLLISLMFAFALANDYGAHPCQRNNHVVAYNGFIQRHILQESFHRGSKWAWRKYLLRRGLCNRGHQFFIEKSDQARVVQICNGWGRLLNPNRGDLCISDSPMLVYEVKVGKRWKCKVKRVVRRVRFVIVACDRIGHQCLPVHFGGSRNHRPNNRARACRLHA